MSQFKDNTNETLRELEYQISRKALKSEVADLRTELEFQVSRHDELKEHFDMLMDHLGLRIENGPRIVKDK